LKHLKFDNFFIQIPFFNFTSANSPSRIFDLHLAEGGVQSSQRIILANNRIKGINLAAI